MCVQGCSILGRENPRGGIPFVSFQRGADLREKIRCFLFLRSDKLLRQGRSPCFADAESQTISKLQTRYQVSDANIHIELEFQSLAIML